MAEQILLLNPRSKRRGRSYRHNRRKRIRRFNRVRRRRYNPIRRRRGASYRHNPRRRRHNPRRRRHNPRRRRHNPRRRRHNRRSFRSFALGGIGPGFIRHTFMPAMVGAVAAGAFDIAYSYVTPKIHLPPSLQTGWGGVAAKSAFVAGGGWALGKFVLKSPNQRRWLAWGMVGAITTILAPAIRGAFSSVTGMGGMGGYIDYQSYALPGTQQRLSGYMPRTGLGEMFSPAAVIQPAGTPVPRQFGGYIAVQPHVMGGGGIAGFDYNSDGM